ncbi:hypothetical protein C9J12_22650 [Photobacterium frigidiphilum]|uniref:DUF2971 domain-containing protein n=1 Tax=Photobacterium frigidiphilum TaxID=264736 RepID=A0A2T3J9J7_9GAMM|nr:hypothetical protein [Photobacterium frigidiphilum]PSU45505.1 hypothetical protein C9J12_22650 [Photobacterium frigidiphilum]
MLVKYYGEISYKKTKTLVPRYTFLEDGLFRFTQPIFLNDKNETKFYPYFNQFSPVDIAWAKKKYLQGQFNNKEKVPSVEMLENMYLKPTGVRFGESFPFMVEDQTGFKTIDDYDEYQFKTMVGKLNQVIVEALSCNIGVFSLSKNVTNKLMWTHYGSDGRGIAVSFKEDHPYFLFNQAKNVSYAPEDRASYTYYKGDIRLNGEPVDSLNIKQTSPEGIFNALISNGVNVHDLVERLICSGQGKLACALELSLNNRSDSFGVKPPLYWCGLILL